MALENGPHPHRYQILTQPQKRNWSYCFLFTEEGLHLRISARLDFSRGIYF